MCMERQRWPWNNAPLNSRILNDFRHVNVGVHLFIVDLVMYLTEQKLSGIVAIVLMTQNEQYIHPSIHLSH